ncbi:putative membrane protein [Halorubrum alkaliphilum]|uniref:Putative membrane protein n=1 Tax=Halorubrum alkaliphilum TaxID=261290 RepID=A0A8T4GC99_9EURY|nr:hypothetical protein [Halorubrum alkaliphilum]MBP1921111.1 putative membrane protein [Halorubrum alkaliphilum]
MIALLGFALVVALLAFHTLVAGVVTRFFRLRLSTSWGWVVYTVVLTPILLLVSTLLFAGFFGLGTGVNLRSPAVVVALLVVLPAVLGAAIDYLYVEPPDEYELPDTR